MPSEKKNLFLTTEVDVPTGEKPEKPGDPIPTRRVGPGLLSELDIPDTALKKLQSGRARGVIRPATADEIEAGEQRARVTKAREIAQQSEDEASASEIERRNERLVLARKLEQERSEQLAALDEKHNAARAEEREEAVDALNDAAGIETPSGGKRKARK